MIDIRHHVYSLAAVFLALAIGMVIGSSFAKQSPAGSRKAILRYENDMRSLKGEIVKVAQKSADDKSALEACETYCKAILPLAINGKLRWRNVVIVQTGDNDELAGSVKKALETAGAKIAGSVDINHDFDFGDDAKISKLLIERGLGQADDPKGNRDKLFRILADAISGRHPDLISWLEKSGVASFNGSFDKPSKLIVLVGGTDSSKNFAEIVDSQLVARYEKTNVTTVGCEASDAVCTFIPAWHKAGIATVDNADKAMGQTALIYALNGETANFGTKKTSDRLIPRTLEIP